MTDAIGGYESASSDGVTVTSNTDSAAGLAESLEAPDKVSEAASELGKRGGKASAEARSAKDAPSEGTSDSPEVGEPEGVPDKPLGKPRDDPKARMLEATRKEAEAKREAKALREENDRLRREFESVRRPEPPPVPREAPKDADPEPDQADFDNYDQYMRAVAAHAGRQEFRKHQAEAQKEQWIAAKAAELAQTVETDVGTFQGKVQEAITADPNALADVPDAMLEILVPTWMLEPGQYVSQANAIADEVMRLDNPVPVLRALAADNGKEFQRIATLQSPAAITRQLAKLDARFEAAPQAPSPRPRISMAKPPVRPVTGQPSVSVGEPDDEASYEAHREFYNAREQKARAQR